MKPIYTILEVICAVFLGMVVMFVLQVWYVEHQDQEQLPADYGMDNPPVTICIENDIVVPCK